MVGIRAIQSQRQLLTWHPLSGMKEMKAGAWLTLPFLFIPAPQPVELCCPHSESCLPNSITSVWKLSSRHAQCYVSE